MVALKFGSGLLPLPAELSAHVIRGSEPPPLPDPRAAAEGALQRPMGSQALEVFVEPGDRVLAILQHGLVSPEALLPAVGAALRRAGASSVRVCLAGGGRPESELLSALGAEAAPEGYESLGKLEQLGTLRARAAVGRADRLLLVDELRTEWAVLPPPEALLLPGCTDRQSSRAFARIALEEEAAGPRLQRQALRLAPPAFALRVATQRSARPAAFFAGDPLEVGRASATFFARHAERRIDRPAPTVVVSAGGAPRDETLLAAAPSLAVAARALEEGGRAVLVAACEGGPGFPPELADLSLGAHEEALRRDYSIRSHRLLQLRRLALRTRAVLVSTGIDDALASRLGFRPAASFDEALAARPAGDLLVLPDGARTLVRVGQAS